MAVSSPTVRHRKPHGFKLALLRGGFALGSRLLPGRTTRAAARLLCTPFASSRSRAAAARRLSGLEHEWLSVEGRQLAVYRWGDPARQPYVLLAHGWSSFALRFLPWVEGLRSLGYAVVAFDQPGHGHSEGAQCSLPDFARSIAAVGRHYGDAAWAIAHSLAGGALVLAQQPQWRVGGAILLAPALDPLAAIRRFGRFIRLRDTLQPRLHRTLVEHTGVALEQLDVRERLSGLSAPVLVVHDRDDDEVPFAEGEAYARHWPGARLLVAEGLGHHQVVGDASVVAEGLAFIQAHR